MIRFAQKRAFANVNRRRARISTESDWQSTRECSEFAIAPDLSLSNGCVTLTTKAISNREI
jgi:hypothetical protein